MWGSFLGLFFLVLGMAKFKFKATSLTRTASGAIFGASSNQGPVTRELGRM